MLSVRARDKGGVPLQFIAYFNFSHLPEVAAVKLGDLLEHIHVGAGWLLVGVILISTLANFVIPLDAVLRRLVPDRNPARTWMAHPRVS